MNKNRSRSTRSKTKITALTILLLTAITLGTALSSTSNTAAPAGSAWIEGSSLHWADGSTEYWFGSPSYVRKTVYSEGFDDGKADNWNIQTADCGSESGVRSSGSDSGTSPYGGSYLLDAHGDDIHTSPSIDLSSYPSPTLSFAMKSYSMDDSSEDTHLEVSSDGGSSWTTLESMHNSGWTFFSKNISSYATSSFKLRVRNVGGNGCGDEGLLDEVEIEIIGAQSPSAASPGNIWIEGDAMRWIDENDYERAYTGSTVRKTVYSEGFDDGTANNWNIQTGDTDSGVTTSPVCSGDSPANCPTPIDSHILQADSSDIHTSPAIDLSSYSSATLNFAVASESMDDSSEDTQVDVSSDGGSTWTTLKTVHNVPTSGSTPLSFSIDISSYTTSNFKLRIDNVGGNGGGDHGFLDEVKITVPSSPSAASPGNAWIENGMLHYIDASGNERKTAQTQVIDDFEDGDVSEYTTVSSHGGASVSSNQAYEGSNSLRILSNAGWQIIQSSSGLDNYPQAGDTFEFWAREDYNAASYGMLFGADGSGNNYGIRLSATNNFFQIVKDQGIGANKLASASVSQSLDTWYKIKVDWGSSGTITATLYDSSNNQLKQISASDTSYTSGGIGWMINGNNGNEGQSYLDYSYITSS